MRTKQEAQYLFLSLAGEVEVTPNMILENLPNFWADILNGATYEELYAQLEENL